MNRIKIRSVSSMVLLLCFAATAALAADGLFNGAPEAPPGYEDHIKARAAVMMGKVPAIVPPTSVPDGIEVRKDVVYASRDGVDLKLDVFIPEKQNEAKSMLLFIHGGGWSKGKKEDYHFYTIAFAEKGYIAATMQYRLSPENTFPAALHDVKCAIAWLKKNADDLGGDPARIALVGGSAGGHLSMMGGYVDDDDLDCPDLPEGMDTRVRAVVNIYGVVDCTPVAQAAHQVNDFIGKPYAEAANQYALASPIHHLTKDDPPTLTFHGTIDELVPVSQADALHVRLNELDIPNYYDRIEGWPHTMDLAQPINDRFRYIMERFFEKHLNR